MNIRILGTAAAEAWPAVFCGCNTCRRAREAGGKDIRSRASVQFGEKHRIDLPPDTWHQAATLGLDLSRLEYLFVSHSHNDHWCTDYLGYLVSPFAHDRPPLQIYGSDAVVASARECRGGLEGSAMILHELRPFEPVEAGSLSFTPILAQHMPHEMCLNYLVSEGDKTVLYASDTGWYPDETWAFLEQSKLDAVISECTCGPLSGGTGHLDFEHLFAMKERLEKAGAYRGGPFIATHFSHNVGLLHAEIENIVGEHGITVAWDGMEIAL